MSDNIRPWKGTLPRIGARVYVDPMAVVGSGYIAVELAGMFAARRLRVVSA